jgi:hypothetical protein
VSYRLRMSGEIHDWLADLHETDPPAAMLVGQALAALMSEGASPGPRWSFPSRVELTDEAPYAQLLVSVRDAESALAAIHGATGI